MKLENIMLSEISQMEKDKYLMISLIYGIWRKKNPTHRSKEQNGGYQGLPGGGGSGGNEMLVKGYRVAVMQNKSRDLMYRHEDYT